MTVKLNAAHLLWPFFLCALAGCGAPSEPEGDGQSVSPSAATEDALTINYVGVIPDDPKALCNGIPGAADGSKSEVHIKPDNENSTNDNAWSPWLGRIGTGRDIDFVFCRVNSAGFVRPKGGASANYAVLQLSPKCPAGSKPLRRYFDAEDDMWGSSGHYFCYYDPLSEDVAPTRQEGDNSHGCNVRMFLCVFEGSSEGDANPFPTISQNLGTPGHLNYGVFGGGGKDPGGYVFTDDENSDNNNSVSYWIKSAEGDYVDSGLRPDYSAIMEAGRDTKLFTKVAYWRPNYGDVFP